MQAECDLQERSSSLNTCCDDGHCRAACLRKQLKQSEGSLTGAAREEAQMKERSYSRSGSFSYDLGKHTAKRLNIKEQQTVLTNKKQGKGSLFSTEKL